MAKAFDKIMEGLTDAADWAAGNGLAVVYMDGQTREMTKAEYDLYMDGRRAGARAVRERCAKIVEFITDPEQDAGSLDPKHCQNVASDAFNDHPARATMNARLKSYGAAIAAAIRAEGE